MEMVAQTINFLNSHDVAADKVHTLKFLLTRIFFLKEITYLFCIFLNFGTLGNTFTHFS